METKQLFAKSFEKTQYILAHLIKNTFFLSQSFLLCRISLIKYFSFKFIVLFLSVGTRRLIMCFRIFTEIANVLAGSKNVEEISLQLKIFSISMGRRFML